MAKQSVLFLLLAVATIGSTYKTAELRGDWLLKDDKEQYKDLKVTVPGGIYTDLQGNKIIDDIFFRYNDNVTRWVPRTNWTYYRTFEVDDDLLNHENIVIVFEGLDTFSSIYINDVKVGESQNMFVEYIYDIKDVLKLGENSIEVRFLSSIEVGKNIGQQYIEGYIIPPECVPPEYQGDCYVNQIRKMQASYSWDWGPSFPSMGIWKNVTIEAYNETSIRYVIPKVRELDNDNWILDVDVYFTENKNKIVKGKIEVELKEKLTLIEDITVTNNEYNEYVVSFSLDVKKDNVQTWWPNGYGDQPLYTVTTTFTSTDGAETISKSKRIGFRTIELVEDDIESGSTYYFKVNGEPIFAKGANEIPLDILPEKGQLSNKVHRILNDVRDNHMNMLRIWGGGVYESDVFLDLCDELGILIWHDYTFASAFYPVHQEFLDNVLVEVRHQTKRLSGHTSIAALCGNNENESNVVSWWDFINKGNQTQYQADYRTLYIDTIMPEINRVTQGKIIFIGSSPSNGKISVRQNYISGDPNGHYYGDTHSYIYDRNSFDPTIYPVVRFISEYGLQSFPCMDSMKTITDDPAELQLDSEFMAYRNHHPDGINQMRSLVEMQFKLPEKNSENYFNAIVYYSQLVDGWGMRVATESHRRYRSYVNDYGEGMTMGCLYWQLNDVWVGPTWAGIDYLGKWKALHYYSKQFFAPVIITGLINSNGVLEIFGVSDLLHKELSNLTMSMDVYNWNSFEPLTTVNLKVDLKPSASQRLITFDRDDFLSNFCGTHTLAKYHCFFRLTLKNGTTDVAPENFVFPQVFKDLEIATPDIKITDVSQIDDNNFEVTVTSDIIAPFVWIDSHEIDGRFSENGWTQVANTKVVQFRSLVETTVEDLVKVLTVTSLRSKEFL